MLSLRDGLSILAIIIDRVSTVVVANFSTDRFIIKINSNLHKQGRFHLPKILASSEEHSETISHAMF